MRDLRGWGEEKKSTEGAAGGGGIFRERSLPEEEGAQVWFLFSWTSLLPYHFVMISGFASLSSFYLSLCMNASIVDFVMFLDVLGCFEPACLHFMVDF